LIEARLRKLIRLWTGHLDRVSADEGCMADGQADKAGADVRPASVVRTGVTENLPRHMVCLLPGPVTIAPAVREAFQQPPIYHRDPEFIVHFEKVRSLLGNLVGGRNVALLNGSGTLANDAIAATLAAEVNAERRTPKAQQESRGLILVNGEFGQRLARQAVRFGLNARVLAWAWGQPWNLSEIAAALAQEPAGSWVWGVHLETSTGVLNDLPGLVRAARPRGIRVCVDCISSLGAVPIDLHDVYLASAASGKSLGAYSGMAMVFADAPALPRMELSRLPSYLDISVALSTVGPCYTFASPIVAAVEAALVEYATPELACARYERHAALGSYVRQNLRDLGLAPLAGEPNACPVVTTFVPPYDESSTTFVEHCRSWGFAIGGPSGYLAKRRMVQIATMGATKREEITAFFQHLGRCLALPSRA
jgi:aspartate aminotransferase-like enzyme